MKAEAFPVPNSVLRCFQRISAARSSKSQSSSSTEAPSSKFQTLRVKWAGERCGCTQTDEWRLITAALELGIWSFPGAWGLELGASAIPRLLLSLSLLMLPATGAAQPKNQLVWEVGDGYRRAKLNLPAQGKAGFTLLGPEVTGLRWTNNLPVARVMERQNLMNGAGVAAGDFDGDGFCDLYFCNKEGPNALYRNLGGWRFEDVGADAGVTCTNQSSTGAVFADLDGDGRLDLLVNSFTGPNACFINLGKGHFTNVTEAAGLVSKGGTTSLALGDMTGDGNLDLYVAYFGIEAILRDGGAYGFRMVNGQPVVTGRYAKRLKIAVLPFSRDWPAGVAQHELCLNGGGFCRY